MSLTDLLKPPQSHGTTLAAAHERSTIFDGRRLEALRQSQLLDAEPPDDLQRLVALAKRRFGVSVALVSLVDSYRQYFAAQAGLPEPFCSTRETGLDSSFCRFVVTEGQPLVITDARTHPLVQDSGAIDLLNVIAYAGMPIVTADGARLGSFCIIETTPRTWTADELTDLADFAATASALVEARVERSRLTSAEREKLDLINRITEGFVSFDREWRVTFANGIAAAMSRRPPEETVGRSLWELIPALVGTRVSDRLMHAMANLGTHEFEWRGVANPGWWEARAVSTPDGLSLYLRDITRRKESERALMQSEARFRKLAEIAPIGICETDAQGACTWVNARARELAGIEGDGMLGAGWARAIHTDDVDRIFGEWARVVATEGGLDAECRFVHADGRMHWVALRTSPVRDALGEVTAHLATIEEITAQKAREQSLQELVATFDRAVRGSDIGIWDWNIPSGRVSFSEQMARMLGYEPAEFGTSISSWIERVHPADLPGASLALERTFSGDAPFYRFPHRLRAKSGEWRWILDAGTIIERDVAGNAVRMVGTHVDIHEAKAAEARFRTLFEKSSEPLLLADAGGIVDGNEAAARLLGREGREELIGCHFARFVPREQPDGTVSRDRFDVVNSALERGESCRFDWTLARADGSTFPAEVSLVPIDLGLGSSVLISLHDLSLRMEQERSLLRAKEAAETTTRAKSDFLARMSHELRSPLNSIIGFSRLLLRSSQRSSDGQEHTYLDRIHANGVHLLELINDVLDISRIEAGRNDLHLEPIDVAAMLRETLAQGEGLVANRPVRLVAQVPDGRYVVEADPHKLRRILINLVGNAIKFTHEGHVTARLVVAPDGTPEAIEVEDTGIGIPADKLEAIFDPFEQVESGASRRYEGSGLGLAISRQLCGVMGYTISVRSTPGAGSTFRIGLRRA